MNVLWTSRQLNDTTPMSASPDDAEVVRPRPAPSGACGRRRATRGLPRSALFRAPRQLQGPFRRGGTTTLGAAHLLADEGWLSAWAGAVRIFSRLRCAACESITTTPALQVEGRRVLLGRALRKRWGTSISLLVRTTSESSDVHGGRFCNERMEKSRSSSFDPHQARAWEREQPRRTPRLKCPLPNESSTRAGGNRFPRIRQ
jgi:hypothetical protein